MRNDIFLLDMQETLCTPPSDIYRENPSALYLNPPLQQIHNHRKYPINDYKKPTPTLYETIPARIQILSDILSPVLFS